MPSRERGNFLFMEEKRGNFEFKNKVIPCHCTDFFAVLLITITSIDGPPPLKMIFKVV
jgi:hypothetical protein